MGILGRKDLFSMFLILCCSFRSSAGIIYRPVKHFGHLPGAFAGQCGIPVACRHHLPASAAPFSKAF